MLFEGRSQQGQTILFIPDHKSFFCVFCDDPDLNFYRLYSAGDEIWSRAGSFKQHGLQLSGNRPVFQFPDSTYHLCIIYHCDHTDLLSDGDISESI